MIRATNVKRGKISPEGLIRIKREAIPESRDAFLKEGEIIVVRSGAYTGDVAMVTKEWAGSVAGYDLVLTLGENVDPVFCTYNLLGDDVQSYFRSQSARSAQPHLNRNQLESTEIPLPPRSEQCTIGAILEAVRRALDLQERLIVLTTELKTTLLHQVFTEGMIGAPEVPVPDALVKYRTGRQRQLPSAQIKERGDWPVVDQGQAFVAGYTDELDKVIDSGLPLIIFGDHTRCLKFIDFPFVLGADGTKVLKADETKFRPRFLYYSLSTLDIPNRGYNRHFTVLKEKRVKQPSLEVQDAVIDKFIVLDRKLNAHRRKCALLAELFRSLLHQLMSAAIRVNDMDISELRRSLAA